MPRWRYIAQRATTGELLDLDLPVEVEELSWALSGAGDLRGTVAPDVGALRDATGRLLLDEWSTLLYAEADGEIRWGGILVRSEFADDEWHLEAAGFSAYLHGLPYLDEFTRIGVDPADAVRELWRHVQSFPDGDLGVAVTADATPVRLGTDAVAEYTPPKLQAAKEILDRFNSGQQIFEDWTWYGYSDVVREYHQVLLDEWPGPQAPADWLQSYADTHVTATQKRPAALAIRDRIVSGQPLSEDWTWGGCPANVARYAADLAEEYAQAQTGAGWLDGYLTDHDDEIIPAKDAEPYSLVWWEATDCGSELDDLASTTPFDYVERHWWNVYEETISHEFRLAYPRVGRRREDLSFVQGDNVTTVVAFESTGDDFANEVVGLGGGEGRAALRRTTAQRDGRLRRAYVYSAKDVLNSDRLDALIRDEMEERRGLLQITSVDVVDHPNAPLAAWQLGDDVLIDADVPWLGRVSQWCRVVGWSLTGEDTATLTLRRSDSFRYGG